MASYPALDLRYAPGPDTAALHEFLYAELDPFEPLAIHDHEAGDGWRVFFRLPAQRDAARAALAAALGPRLLGLSPAEVDDGDWARRSQAALTAVRAGRIVVAPPWDVPGLSAGASPSDAAGAAAQAGDIVIVIEPSMGFGTGHHATTRLCLELLQSVDLAGRRVIDVGTGSGVLALAALRLGAAEVAAVDHDPDALQNARENFARNGADGAIAIVEGDLASLGGRRADLAVANLTGAVLQRHAAALHALAPELIVSGFSPGELADVAAALGVPVADERRDGDWAAARLRG